MARTSMKAIYLAVAVCCTVQVAAQKNAGQTAKAYIRQGDYANAIVVLSQALEADRDNIEMKKDLAFAYYLQRDFPRALSAIQPVIEDRDNDAQSFQILGMIHEAQNNRRDAERAYRVGIRRFPESGVLYNELGELLWSNASFPEALSQWLKGIQRDQSFAGNYFNAAKYYYLSQDKVWGLIYGEMFINLESYSRRTPEVKTMLFEGYKKLFTESDIYNNQDTKNEFVRAFLDIMKDNVHIVSNGVTPEALSVLRTRFLLSWQEKYASKFPFRLFEYQRQLARAGMFDAYNQWIFGAASNLTTFQQWTVTHTESYNKFTSFQKNRVFKVPEGQYYNARP
jgi:Tfp pilus assembly protein PilF